MSENDLPLSTESPFRTLIVDDNVGSAKVLGMLFKKLGHDQVELAHSGHDAIEKAHQFHPDVMILDLVLGDISGWEVARTIRHDAELDGTLLVALTGNGTPEDRHKSLEAGFHMHLVKPIGVDRVQDVISLLRDFRRQGVRHE